MKYRLMTENDLEYVVEKNNEYYNNVEGCCWTYEKAGTIWAPITIHAIINAISFGIVVLP